MEPGRFYENFHKLSRDELEKELATGTTDLLRALVVLNELHHRDADKQTKVMIWLTVAVTILTVVNVALVAYTVFSSAGR